MIVPVVWFLSRRFGARVGWLAAVPLAISTLAAILSGWLGTVFEAFQWEPIGFFGFRADGLSIPILFTVSLLCTVIAVYSMPYMTHRLGKESREYGLYFALYLLYSTGMIGAVLATNLIEFYLFFELMLIPSYFLIARWGYGDRDRISFMYFMWTHVGALALLAGILTLWAVTGTFDLSALSSAVIPTPYRFWITMMILAGLLVKMAAFGVHVWLPQTHAEAPTPISALLSPAMIGIGGYAMVRILMTISPELIGAVSFQLSIWALITMVYGALMALVQDDIKRLLAYSSISQMGYILLGIASVQIDGVSGSMLHYLSHGMGKGILFMVAGIIIAQCHGTRSISKLGGLARKMPVTASAALIGFLTILGVPPTSGFISEFLIFFGLINSAMNPVTLLKVVVAIGAVVSTALTAGYTLWTMKRVFFGPVPAEMAEVHEAPLTMTVPLIILAATAILVGIFPDSVIGGLLAQISNMIR
ncbi:MAG: NADH-quinone oxidoreductase subunit M [Candidatus Bathyarchaeia archaeon]